MLGFSPNRYQKWGRLRVILPPSLDPRHLDSVFDWVWSLVFYREGRSQDSLIPTASWRQKWGLGMGRGWEPGCLGSLGQ